MYFVAVSPMEEMANICLESIEQSIEKDLLIKEVV